MRTLRLLLVGLWLLAAEKAGAQIATWQLSLVDSTQNILYTYYPNIVAITGLPAGAQVRFGDSVITPAEGKYIISPRRRGVGMLRVYDKGSKEIYAKEYTVNRLDGPYIKIGKAKYEVASVGDIMANPSVSIYFPDCPLKVHWRISDYTISLMIDGVIEAKSVSGHDLNNVPFDAEVRNKIAIMKNGDKIFIEEIRAYGPDGGWRKLGSKMVKITFEPDSTVQQYQHSTRFRRELKVVVDAMIADNTLRSSKGIGWLEYLLDVAKDTELIELTDHENTAVKNYAFKALTTKNTINLFPIIMKHLHDTNRVRSNQGCTGGLEQTNEYFLSSMYVHNTGGYKLSPLQQATIDSILLFDSTIFSSWILATVLRA